MRLPRRVPWSDLSELDTVCAWVYHDEHDIPAKINAINRISAWRAITSLPHAIDSCLSLLVVIVQDIQQQQSTYPASYLSLRQSYANAIIRLINGLVDPLQVGTYARPIAAIAAQLGIPSWLVELRHAATHEELPSLDLLREGARQSMSWLLHNYFLPTLNPDRGPNTSSTSATPLRPLEPLLKTYKTTMKLIIRDTSLTTQHKPQLIALYRDIERWISEIRVAANVAIGEVGWSSSTSGVAGENDAANDVTVSASDADPKEIWALESFCDTLAQKGMLVPLSKKKRRDVGSKSLPESLVSLWKPLLQQVHSLHPAFPSVFCRRFVYILLSIPSTSTLDATEDEISLKADPLYALCLADWIQWGTETWNNEQGGFDLGKDTLLTLLLGLGTDMSNASDASLTLLKTLATQYPNAGKLVDLITSEPPRHSDWDQDNLAVMSDRLAALERAKEASSIEVNISESAHRPSAKDSESSSPPLIPGWHRLETGVNWKPCPIGVYYVC